MSKLFANGTEGEAWMGVWCEHCTHDHDMHESGRGSGPGCPIVFILTMSDDIPAAIVPQPAGTYHLPPLHVCKEYAPCEPCGGDPFAVDRARVIAITTAGGTDA